MAAAAAKQTWVVMGVLMNMLGQGMVLSFSSILLPGILASDSKIKVDLHTASWVASCVAPASVPGFFLSSYLMDRFGRKFAYLIAVIPCIVGWFVIYVASSFSMLIIGRALCGFTAGGTVILGVVVIGEYTSPGNRGMFLVFKTIAVYIGNMTSHVIGNYLKWNVAALIFTIPHIISFFIVLTWPESPAWLANKKKFKLSEKSFYWLRGSSPESRKELEELISAQKEIAQDERNTFMEQCLRVANKFTKRNFIKPTVIIIFCAILLEACGKNFFAAYALQIIGEITESKTNSFYYTFAIDITITVTAFVSSVLVKVIKRRTLFSWSGLGSLFVLICVCLYLFLSSHGVISNSKPWIPITLFLAYFIISNLGCIAIPLALIGEIYPLEHRSIGAAISGVIFSCCLMTTMQLTPYLLVVVKVYGTFAVYGTVMGISLVILFYIVPETKDRTLQEIEYFFNFGKFRDANIDRDEETRMKMLA